MQTLRRFLKFVAPSIASMWIFSLYTLVDGIFVARGVGEHALSAVNLSLPFTSFIFSIGILFATGTATVISIALGRGDRRLANAYFSQNLAVVSAVCIAVTVVVLLALEPIAVFLGGGEDTLEYIKQYIGTLAPFALFFAVSYNLEVQVKADGAPHMSTVGVCSCAVMNIVLDYLFVIRMGWGVFGAAFATGLSQVTSTAIFAMYFIFKGKNLRFGRFDRDLCIYRKIIPIGLPEGFTELSGALVTLLFNLSVIRVLGEDKVASYAVISYVNTFVLMAMCGISQGIQPLVSYNLGASNIKMCRTMFRYGLVSVLILSVLFFAAVWLFTPFFVSLFLDAGSSLRGYTAEALRRYSFSFLLLGFNVLISGYFTAVDMPRRAFPISLGRSLLFLLPALGVTGFLIGGEALWYTTLISEGVCLFMSVFLLFKSRGKIADKSPK